MTSAIEIDRVGKRYFQLQERAMLLRSLVPFAPRTRTERWALQDLSFSVGAGETVGILGRNGAGKTTLLRLLAGVSQPTVGLLRIRGRVAPLISVGVGFHQEMSGRENVYVNGMLLGLTKAEIAARFDEIVAFAELEEFIDTPVKFYSTGMFMRLGFSVAVHVEPEVLLVDEVLAVGDIAFQLKCLELMRTLQQQGMSIILVSHSMHAIRLLCPRVVLLRHGRLEYDGDTETAISLHHQLLSADAVDRAATHEKDASLEGCVTVVDRQLVGPSGPTNHMDQAHVFRYATEIRFLLDIDDPQVVFQVLSEAGTLVYSMHTTIGQRWQRYRAGQTAKVEVTFRPRLGGGTYRLTTIVMDRDGRRVVGMDPVGTMVYVSPPLGSGGVADLEATISVDGCHRTDHSELLLGRGREVETERDQSHQTLAGAPIDSVERLP